MQELGVEEKVDQVPSGLGSWAKLEASVTGRVGREARGQPPTQGLAGRAQGVRVGSSLERR